MKLKIKDAFKILAWLVRAPARAENHGRCPHRPLASEGSDILNAPKTNDIQMKKIILWCVVISCAILPFSVIRAQDITKRNGYQLVFKSNYNELDPVLKKRLIETFFVVYPELAKEYNPNTAKKVIFFMDTAYKGVAATSNGRVVFSPAYMKNHPEDIDVVTHEVMHIVQNYGNSNGPGWLTEGIADYARYKYGVNNAAAKWVLPDLKPSHYYENSYRVTARFFAWIELKVKPGTIKKLDESLRGHTYQEASWKELTGKTLNELWAAYIKNPSIV